MSFDLPELLRARHGEGYALAARHLNPQLPRMLHAIGFDRVYERAEGAYLWDSDGNRYTDFLAGFGVFAAGRNHPVVRKALHDMLDAELADLVQFDAALLPGLLGERLLAKAPGLDRVYFCNSGTEAVEAALKFARYATGRRRIIYCDHAYHGLTVGSLSVNGSDEFRRGFAPLLPDARIPFGDLDALEAELRRGDVAGSSSSRSRARACAVSPPGFLAAAQKLLHDNGALLICDEVQIRDRPHRAVLRLPARRRRAGHRRRRQGAVRWLRAGRRHAGQGMDLRQGLLVDRPGAGARLHVRLERRRDDGGPGLARRHRGREAGGERRADRDRAAARRSSCWWTSTSCWLRCAAAA